MKAMARLRSHSIEFKRQVAKSSLSRVMPVRGFHGPIISRQLVRVWVQKYEAGALDEDTQLRSTPGIRSQDCGVDAWLADSARNPVPKRGSEKRTTADKREYIRHCRPRGVSFAEMPLMGIGRSAFYDTPEARCAANSLRKAAAHHETS